MKRLLILSVLLGLISVVQAQTLIRVPQDQPSIQAGINAATNGDTVLVAEGPYVENIRVNKKIVLASLFVLDGDTSHISKTIINGGSPLHADTATVVSVGPTTDTTTIIVGFTIKGGTGTKRVSPWWHPAGTDIVGGGILLDGGGVTIKNNIVTQNVITVLPPASQGWGAGIAIYDVSIPGSTTYSIVESNTVSNNTIVGGTVNGGGGIDLIGSGRVVGNKIIGNASMYTINSAGQSLSFKKDTVVYENNLVQGNSVTVSGSGIGIGGGSMTGYVRNNVIVDNYAGGDGVGVCFAVDTAFAVFERNYIARNNGPASIGIILARTDRRSLIQNNIIADNTGHGIYVGGNNSIASADVICNTIVGNALQGIATGTATGTKVCAMNNIIKNGSSIEISGAVFASYNLIEGSYAGTGNFSADPIFVMHTDSFYIHHNSPARDVGVASATVGGVLLTAPTTDYRGNLRVGNPDLGAHEFDPSVGVEREDNAAIPMEFGLSQNYPNPFNPSTKITYSLPFTLHTSLKIYDILGRVVATLVDAEKSAGFYQAEWNATVSSGVYFYRLEAVNKDGHAFAETKRMMLVK